MKTIYINEKRKLSTRKIKRIAKKINKINKKNEVAVAVSNNLLENKELINEIESYRIKVLDGRWLLKFFLCEIVRYFANYKEKPVETLIVAILINNIEEAVFSQIIEIAKSVKVLKLVTKRPSNFSYIEGRLYDEYGIGLQVTNNKQKALANVDAIINFDFDEAQINEYVFFDSPIIVNIKNKICINNSNFFGNILNYYKISYKQEIFDEIEKDASFDTNVLYESLIYRKDTFLNIKRQMDNDGVRLIELF